MFNKNKKKCKSTKFTIQSLIYSLQDIMTENPRLSWDSEVIISDLQMSEFRNNFKLYVINDYETRTQKLGLFLLPNDPSDFEGNETGNENNIPETISETQKDSSWLDKYGV